jgi:hypothetical protein
MLNVGMKKISLLMFERASWKGSPASNQLLMIIISSSTRTHSVSEYIKYNVVIEMLL